MNILLVEDNEADRRAIREAFLGICKDENLHMAEDGEKALNFVFRKEGFEDSPTPDLILLDLNLPGTHGHAVLKELKSNPEKKNIPVIVFTSSNYKSDICEAYNLNANCYINKPLRYAELVSLMKLLCDFWVKEVRYCHA
jgi:two-component system, chemotaxis family, response regulator Rcp1